MSDSGEGAEILISTPAAGSLRWQQWDDVYLVYQASSAETHVFNDSTALILRCLEHGPQSLAAVRSWTETALGVEQGQLAADHFAFAVGRLEELGLVDSLEQALATQ